MTPLSLLLSVKIAITAFLVAVPFLVSSAERLDAIVSARSGSLRFYRLYGVAMVALLIGYAFGIAEAQAGRMPWGVVAMGIVSNGVPAVMFLSGAVPKQAKMLGFFFALIAVGLVGLALFPGIATTRVFP